MSQSRSERMKKYWKECQECHYSDGKKVHKRICYDCGECRTRDGTKEGRRCYSEIYENYGVKAY